MQHSATTGGWHRARVKSCTPPLRGAGNFVSGAPSPRGDPRCMDWGWAGTGSQLRVQQAGTGGLTCGQSRLIPGTPCGPMRLPGINLNAVRSNLSIGKCGLPKKALDFVQALITGWSPQSSTYVWGCWKLLSANFCGSTIPPPPLQIQCWALMSTLTPRPGWGVYYYPSRHLT